MNPKPFKISIVDLIDDANLRDISNGLAKISALRTNHPGLRPGESVQFINKARNRTRLVVNVNGVYAVLLLPTDTTAQTSVYLQGLRALRTINSHLRVMQEHSAHIKEAEERLDNYREYLARREKRNAKR
jgi:hypothetical protein